jgi:hypothetical protein
MNNKLYTKNSVKILNNNYDNLYYMIINKRLITKCLWGQDILNIISEYEIHKNNYTKIELDHIYYYITMILGYPFNNKFVNNDFNVSFDDFLDILHKLKISFIAKIKLDKRLLCVSNSYLNLPKLLIIYDVNGYTLHNIYELNNEETTYTDYNYYITEKNKVDPFNLLKPVIILNPRHSLNKLLDIYPNLPTNYKTVSENEFKEYVLGIDYLYLLKYDNNEGTLIKISKPYYDYTRFDNIVTHIELRVRQLHYIMENNPFAILIYPTLKTKFNDYIINGKINESKLNDFNLKTALMSFQTLGKGIGWSDSNVYLYIYLDKKLIDLAIKYHNRILFKSIPNVLQINEYCLWGANFGNIYDTKGGGGQASIISKTMSNIKTIGHDFGIVTMTDCNNIVLNIT